MKKLEALKLVGSVVVSVGVGAIMKAAIGGTISGKDYGTIKKVCVGIGGFVLGSMVVDAATNYVDDKIDAGAKAFTEGFNEVKKEIKEEDKPKEEEKIEEKKE